MLKIPNGPSFSEPGARVIGHLARQVGRLGFSKVFWNYFVFFIENVLSIFLKVFLSFRYSADLRRSRLVPHWTILIIDIFPNLTKKSYQEEGDWNIFWVILKPLSLYARSSFQMSRSYFGCNYCVTFFEQMLFEFVRFISKGVLRQ